MKYNKKIKIRPNLSKKFQIMFEGLIKKLGQNNKKNSSPSAVFVALGEGSSSPSVGVGALGEEFLKKRVSHPRMLWAGTRGRN
jgi:hypothetical protein